MGSFDGADVSELIGSFLFYQFSEKKKVITYNFI